MTLRQIDELRHEAGSEPNWQENHFFVGYDTDHDAAVYFHTARAPRTRNVDLKVLVRVNGRTVSVKRTHQGNDNFEVPGVDEATFDPFRHVDLAYSDTGVEWSGDDGWVAEGEGEHAFGFRVRFENTVGPVDYADAAASLGLAEDTVRDHYEVGGSWHGEVWIGDDRSEVSGLFVRDHSWGPRDLAKFHHAWWTPMYFPHVQKMFSGVKILRDGKWQGFLLEVDGDKTVVQSLDHFVLVDGFPEARGWESATVLALQDGKYPQRYEFSRLLHVPCHYPEMGEGHFMNDMMSTVTWGEHTGFGICELNRH